MKVNGAKYLGINQWIPEQVMENAVFEYLKVGVINRESIRSHLREFLRGENRIGKAAEYTVHILERNGKHLDLLRENVGASSYLRRPESERRAILVCLLCLTYPVAYDLILALASGFKVQPSLNRQYCARKMSAIYGSNRGVFNAIGAVIPSLVELKLIKRTKVGLYSSGEKLVVLHPFVSEFVVYTDIKLSGSKSVLRDDLDYRPWYFFFDIGFPKRKKYPMLRFSEGRIGQGYLTI